MCYSLLHRLLYLYGTLLFIHGISFLIYFFIYSHLPFLNINIPSEEVLNQVDFNYRRRRFVIFSTLPRDDEEDEEVEPGKMRVAEIKAELSMRKVDFSDCFDKESLVNKLQEARMSGKADPSIIDEFNRKKVHYSYLR